MTTLAPSTTAAIVLVTGHVPCGCGHCREFDLQAGDLIHEQHVGVGESTLAAVNDALEQAYERHPHAELAAECYTLIP